MLASEESYEPVVITGQVLCAISLILHMIRLIPPISAKIYVEEHGEKRQILLLQCLFYFFGVGMGWVWAVDTIVKHSTVITNSILYLYLCSTLTTIVFGFYYQSLFVNYGKEVFFVLLVLLMNISFALYYLPVVFFGILCAATVVSVFVHGYWIVGKDYAKKCTWFTLGLIQILVTAFAYFIMLTWPIDPNFVQETTLRNSFFVLQTIPGFIMMIGNFLFHHCSQQEQINEQ